MIIYLPEQFLAIFLTYGWSDLKKKASKLNKHSNQKSSFNFTFVPNYFDAFDFIFGTIL